MAGEVSSHTAGAMLEAAEYFQVDRNRVQRHLSDPSQLEKRFGRVDWTEFLAMCREIFSEIGSGPELVPLGQRYLRDQFKTRNAHFYGQFTTWDRILWVTKHFMARRMIRGYAVDYEKLGHNRFHVVQTLEEPLEGDADFLYFLTGVWTGSSRMANLHHKIENLVVSPNRAEADILFDTRALASRVVHNPLWCRIKTGWDLRTHQAEARKQSQILSAEETSLRLTANHLSDAVFEVGASPGSKNRASPPPFRKQFWLQPDRAIEELRRVYVLGQQTEADLQKTRNRFRALFDSVSDTLFLFRSGELFLANQAAETFLSACEPDRQEVLKQLYQSGMRLNTAGPSRIRYPGSDGQADAVCLVHSCTALSLDGTAAYLISATDLSRAHDLANRLADISTTERRRIARDLHDGLSQLLTSLSVQAKAASISYAQSPGSDALENISGQAERCMKLGARVYQEINKI
jgi:signal transduction histidine kinase